MFRGIEHKVNSLQEEMERVKRDQLSREIAIEKLCELDNEVAAHLDALERALREIGKASEGAIDEIKAAADAIFARVRAEMRTYESKAAPQFREGDIVLLDDGNLYTVDSMSCNDYVVLKDGDDRLHSFLERDLTRGVEAGSVTFKWRELTPAGYTCSTQQAT